MSFEHWGYTFEGAWSDPANLEPRAGVYAVWCKDGDKWTVFHVGESEDVKTCVANHSKAKEWQGRCSGTLYYAATYTPSIPPAGRQEIVQKILQLNQNATTGD